MKYKYTLLSIVAAGMFSTSSIASELMDDAYNKFRAELMDDAYNVSYLHGDYPGYYNPYWMSAIDGGKRLSDISIPGTHSSMSMYGGDISQTQSLPVSEQLKMGIRYFDVAFKLRDGDLLAYNGSVYQNQLFDKLMLDISYFLDINPKETVIIRVKNAGASEGYQRDFYNRFLAVVRDYSHNHHIPKSNNPTMDEMRGKFIFIPDFNTFGERLGIDISSLKIQDNHYLPTNWSLYSTWESIKSKFNSKKDGDVSLIYLSGAGGSFPYFVASGKSNPETYAPQLWTGVSTTDSNKYPDFPRTACAGYLCSINFDGTNQLTAQSIIDNKFPENLGVVVMDFPGGKLVDAIIQSNNPKKMPVIYEHMNQQGGKKYINGDIPSLKGFNDKMSSWNIPSGWELRFYEHDDYKGRYFTRGTGVGNVDGNWNDIVSSVKVLQKQ